MKTIFFITFITTSALLAPPSISALESEVSVNYKHTLKLSAYDSGYLKIVKELKKIGKNIQRTNVKGPITIEYQYSSEAFSTSSDIPLPPSDPELGTVMILRYCSGDARLELERTFRNTLDSDGDGKKDSMPQWEVTGFREINAQSPICAPDTPEPPTPESGQN